jgi:hypothetical protein
MTTLSATVVAQLIATLNDPLTLSSPTDPLSYTKKISFTNGTGIGQADRMWHAQRTVGGSSIDSLDMVGGLLDGLGDAFTPARIKGILVSAAAANPNILELTRPAVNGVPLFKTAGDALFVVPGGLVLWVAPTAAGVVVTAGTGDLIDLVNPAAGSCICDVAILGASA